MKKFCFRAYRACLRSMGLYGLLMCFMAAWTLTFGWSQGMSIGPMALATLTTLAFSVAMTNSKLTPNWLADPDGIVKALIVFVGSGPLMLVFGVAAIAVIGPLGFETQLGKSLSILVAFPALVLGTVMGWAALFYGILPNIDQSVTPMRPSFPLPE